MLTFKRVVVYKNGGGTFPIHWLLKEDKSFYTKNLGYVGRHYLEIGILWPTEEVRKLIYPFIPISDIVLPVIDEKKFLRVLLSNIKIEILELPEFIEL